MAKTLTRSELFELIWSRPRSALAAEFGISDVAIGKHCIQARIPGPPPGYWAKAKPDEPNAERLALVFKRSGIVDWKLTDIRMPRAVFDK